MIKDSLRQKNSTGFTIGLILCDQLRDQFSGDFPEYETMFKTAFEGKTSAFAWKTFDAVTGEFPTDLDVCDGYLISGSRSSVYEGKKMDAVSRRFYQQIKSQKQTHSWSLLWSPDHG